MEGVQLDGDGSTKQLVPRSRPRLRASLAMGVLVIALLGVLIALVLALRKPPAPGDLVATQELIEIVGRRASMMRGVAASKFSSGHGCVFDAQRELAVLEAAADAAKKHGIREASALVFAQIQMDCSKQIEQFWLDEWTASATDEAADSSSPTLEQIREALGELTEALFAAWRAAVAEWRPWRRGVLDSHVEQLLAEHFTHAARGPCGGDRFRGMLAAALLSAGE